MVKRLVEFSLEQGGSVLVEIDEPPAGPVTRGLGKDHSALVEQAGKTFEDATATITPAARSLIARLRSVEDAPDEIGIQFGVQLSASDRGVHRLSSGPGQLYGVDDLAARRRRERLNGRPWKASSATRTSTC